MTSFFSLFPLIFFCLHRAWLAWVHIFRSVKNYVRLKIIHTYGSSLTETKMVPAGHINHTLLELCSPSRARKWRSKTGQSPRAPPIQPAANTTQPAQNLSLISSCNALKTLLWMTSPWNPSSFFKSIIKSVCSGATSCHMDGVLLLLESCCWDVTHTGTVAFL